MIRTTIARAIIGAALVAGVAGTFATPADAQARRMAAGTLACRGSSSVGFIIGSRRILDCTFRSVRGYQASYEGSIRRFGLDIGVTGRNVLLWNVLAPTRAPRPDALNGTYVGVSGSVALGLGVAGNALVGGSNQTITLQPISVEGQTGVNLALGVGDLTLRGR
jgi:hypothetical protein